jgi:integrase
LSTASRLILIRGILGSTEEPMPRKYQNGVLQIRRDVKRPYYYVRVSVPRISKNGERETGRPREVLGFLDEISRKRAMELRAQLLEAVNSKRLLVQSQAKFKDVARRFVDIRVPQLGIATQAKYRTQIRLHIVPAFGELKMCDIDQARVEAWLTAKAEAGLGWWTRIDLKGVLSAIFTAAKGWKLWEGENPTEGVRIGKKKLVREKRLLTAEQLRMILAALAERERFIVRLLFGLGLRISEVLGLRWSDVDFTDGTVTIRRRWWRGDLSEEGEGKSEAAARTLQLGRSLVDEFKQRHPGAHRKNEFVFLSDQPHLFTGNVPPDDRDLLREYFRPVVKKLGLYYKGFGWHAFRRANITFRQTVGGATPMEAQKSAGHASFDMTYLYTLTDPQREAEQVDRMFDYLMGVEPGKPQ